MMPTLRQILRCDVTRVAVVDRVDGSACPSVGGHHGVGVWGSVRGGHGVALVVAVGVEQGGRVAGGAGGFLQQAGVDGGASLAGIGVHHRLAGVVPLRQVSRDRYRSEDADNDDHRIVAKLQTQRN
jgi:hypothetical protein